MMRCKAADPMMCEVESPSPDLTDVQSLTPRDLTKALIKLQSFEGSFSLSTDLATMLDVSMVELEAKIRSCGIGLAEGLTKEVWATVLAVTMFETKLEAEKEIWELVAEKAKTWVASLEGLKGEDLKHLETLAREVCGH
jgi:hypothetical protein